jgi:hypothetical protein
MLSFEYKLEDQEIIIEGEPRLDVAKKSFEVMAILVSDSPKWAGHPDRVHLTGNYDLALLQRLRPGEHLLVSGLHTTANNPEGAGRLFSTSTSPLSNVKAFVDNLQPLSGMNIEADCGPMSEAAAEHAKAQQKQAATAAVIQWIDSLKSVGRWTEPLIDRFLFAYPEHFNTAEHADLGVTGPWEALCRVVAPLNEENPSRAGYPWIAPQKLVDDLIGPAVRAALYAYAKEQGRDVISRPSLSVVPADSLEKHCEGGEANSF